MRVLTCSAPHPVAKPARDYCLCIANVNYICGLSLKCEPRVVCRLCLKLYPVSFAGFLSKTKSGSSSRMPRTARHSSLSRLRSAFSLLISSRCRDPSSNYLSENQRSGKPIEKKSCLKSGGGSTPCIDGGERSVVEGP